MKPNDEFDTGSESESELTKNDESPLKITRNYSTTNRFGSDTSDRLNQIRSRLSLGASTSIVFKSDCVFVLIFCVYFRL